VVANERCPAIANSSSCLSSDQVIGAGGLASAQKTLGHPRHSWREKPGQSSSEVV
jgi:hypothetical protein